MVGGKRDKNSNEQSWVGRRGIQPLKFVGEMVWLSGTIPPIVGDKTSLVAEQLTREEYLRAIGGECDALQI